MKVGSLFSGIGGIDLGLQRAGMEIVWQVENDEWCRRVLARHFPDAVRYGDVRDCHGEVLADAEGNGVEGCEGAGPGRARRGVPDGCRQALASVDLICGGFPCQPVSHAGRRLGAEDERWLWPEFMRIIREVRPRWVLVENVPGLLSIDDGRLFGGVLRDLAEGGYDAEWDCIPASALGAPHIRDRVFVVAHNRGQRDGVQSVARTERSRTAISANDGADGQVADSQPTQRRKGAARGHNADGEDTRRQEAAGGLGAGGETLADAEHTRQGQGWSWEAGRAISECGAGWWATEPDVGRVAHGIPARVDRLRGLGNAVVPQVAEYIGRLIMEAP